eukprot:Skav227274  [mRNA]  locus=scaffold3803:105876:109202:- [translate_table: standard]
MPSTSFLSLLKEQVDAHCLSWIPWKSRTSEADELRFTETRRPKTDNQLLKTLLASTDDVDPIGPEAVINHNDSIEVVVSKCQAILSIALAMLGCAHLLVLKRFHSKFLDLAIAKPRDSHLRCPSLAEIRDADKVAWLSVTELMYEQQWSLNDSLNEIAFCRQTFHTSLAHRLKAPNAAAAASVPQPPKRKDLPAASSTKDKSEPSPKQAKQSATQKKAGGEVVSFKSKDWDPSWAKQNASGKGICIRYHFGKCKAGDTCRYAHECPIPVGALPVDPTFPVASSQCATNFLSPSISSAAVSLELDSGLGPPPKFFLDLYSGHSSPVSVAAGRLSVDRFEPIDKNFGDHMDLLDDDVFADILALAGSGLVGAALAAPYCSKHSMATLRKGSGPAPVRTPDFLDGLPSNTFAQQLSVQESAIIHDRARLILSEVEKTGGMVLLENPPTSMSFLDPLMAQWIQQIAPFCAQTVACTFGLDWLKAWMFVSNKVDVHQLASECLHPPGSHERIAGVRLPDGTFLTRLTAEYPVQLAEAIATIISRYTSHHGQVATLRSWKTLLPPKLCWKPSHTRIEDGGGQISTALHVQPASRDPFQSLRRMWLSRVSRSGDCHRILAHILRADKGPPLDDAAILPYLQDCAAFLQLDEGSFDDIMAIRTGQPFRLQLWKRLMLLLGDPEVSFFDRLHEGVPLGVSAPLEPAPIWPQQDAAPVPDSPLLVCESSWKSALSDPQLVQELLEEELRLGFIVATLGDHLSSN